VFRVFILSFAVLLSCHVCADDIHKEDFKWFQFNIYKGTNNKLPFGKQKDTFFEMEFGGLSGVLDLYGFFDVFDAFDSHDSDNHNGDNFFMKVAPRFSLDSMTGEDLAVGPFKEWYISTLVLVADRALFQEFLGLGTTVELPWFGKVGANLMARYVRENYGADNESTWDGYLLATNWFKPFYTFANSNTLTYQGYLEYSFGAYKISDSSDHSDNSIEWYNGFYWHSQRYAVGYALKFYKDMALLKNKGYAGETSGIGHYLIVTYKF
jgi:nucleoside-specific channel-forming protein